MTDEELFNNLSREGKRAFFSALAENPDADTVDMRVYLLFLALPEDTRGFFLDYITLLTRQKLCITIPESGGAYVERGGGAHE